MEQVLVNLTLLLLTLTNSIIFICIVKVYSRVNIFQYKLKNYYLSMFLVFIYISIFFIALYCLRIYMLRDITDLRFIPKYLTLVKNSILLYPLDSIIFLSFIVTLLLIELEDEKRKIYVNNPGFRIILDTNCTPNRAYL